MEQNMGEENPGKKLKSQSWREVYKSQVKEEGQ